MSGTAGGRCWPVAGRQQKKTANAAMQFPIRHSIGDVDASRPANKSLMSDSSQFRGFQTSTLSCGSTCTRSSQWNRSQQPHVFVFSEGTLYRVAVLKGHDFRGCGKDGNGWQIAGKPSLSG